MPHDREGRVLMVQGTASHAGKSVLVTALCRIFAQDGLRVAPFKAQNMSLNSYATPDGGEIGRAQAVQAEAAGVAPAVEMNPILLKPESDRRSQIVALGKPLATVSARDYYPMKARLWPAVATSLRKLRARYDVVVIEGAGSPAEINLRAQEIVNMRVALHTRAPVLLVGDIDRGGVFASLVGTMELLRPRERALVRGFVINKMRGDFSLLDSGLRQLKRRTGVPTLGVLPYFTHVHIPEEDSLGIRGADPADAVLDIAVMRLPHMANFDDFDPLRREPGIGVRYVSDAAALGRPDLIIIPGAKSTIADLAWLRRTGLARALLQRSEGGTPIIGICGGYQMLGQRILDPLGVESPQKDAPGLGLLPVCTVFGSTKATDQVQGRVAADRGLFEGCAGLPVKGYEIHMGRTTGKSCETLFALERRSGRPVHEADGAMDAQGRVLGVYLHGLFHNDALRRHILHRLACWKDVRLPASDLTMDSDAEYDKLAALVREHLNMPTVYRIAGVTAPS